MAHPGQSQQQPFWRSREFVIAITGALVGAIVGAFLAFIFPVISHALNASPPDSTVIRLMDQDVLAALHHDGELASQMYSSSAVVIDAGCQSPDSGTVFTGREQIKQRYNTLPHFASLAHVNIHVTWIPNDKSATQATATADTVGALMSSAGGPIPIRGHEQWTFALISGQWLITSFTYNLCLLSSS